MTNQKLSKREKTNKVERKANKFFETLNVRFDDDDDQQEKDFKGQWNWKSKQM